MYQGEILAGCWKSPPASFSPRKHPQRSPEATPPVLSSAAALLDELFEHPTGTCSCCATCTDSQSSRAHIVFQQLTSHATVERTCSPHLGVSRHQAAGGG